MIRDGGNPFIHGGYLEHTFYGRDAEWHLFHALAPPARYPPFLFRGGMKVGIEPDLLPLFAPVPPAPHHLWRYRFSAPCPSGMFYLFPIAFVGDVLCVK